MVTRCVCFNQSFVDLRKIARRTKARTIGELQQHVTFGRNCCRCHPYVIKMLVTGETVFAVMDEDEAARWLAQES